MQKLRDQQKGVTIYFVRKISANQKDAAEAALFLYYAIPNAF